MITQVKCFATFCEFVKQVFTLELSLKAIYCSLQSIMLLNAGTSLFIINNDVLLFFLFIAEIRFIFTLVFILMSDYLQRQGLRIKVNLRFKKIKKIKVTAMQLKVKAFDCNIAYFNIHEDGFFCDDFLNLICSLSFSIV